MPVRPERLIAQLQKGAWYYLQKNFYLNASSIKILEDFPEIPKGALVKIPEGPLDPPLFRHKATLNSQEISPVPLAISELCLSEDIR